MTALNVYATLDQIKATLDITGTTYDAVLTDHLRRASRLVERSAGYEFYPALATRYEDGGGTDELWLSQPWLELTTVYLSSDMAATYTALTAADWWASNGKIWDTTPYIYLAMNPNGSYGEWYAGQRTVKILGITGWHRNYANAWENTGDTVQDASGITAVATSVTVGDADGVDALGMTPRFSIGNLLKIEAEYLAVTGVNSGTNVLTVVRGANGTTAATHANATAIYSYRPDEAPAHATLIQAARLFKRGQQAFADAGTSFELGQLAFARGLDPEAEAILWAAGLRRLAVG